MIDRVVKKRGAPFLSECHRGHPRSFFNRSGSCKACRNIREREFRKAAREGYEYRVPPVPQKVAG